MGVQTWLDWSDKAMQTDAADLQDNAAQGNQSEAASPLAKDLVDASGQTDYLAELDPESSIS